MSDRVDGFEPGSAEAAMEAFRRFTEFERELADLGADDEADRVIAPIADDTSRGWVVVAIDRLLNGRPALRDVFGPFDELDEATRYADRIEENGTRIFIAAVRDPSSFP